MVDKVREQIEGVVAAGLEPIQGGVVVDLLCFVNLWSKTLNLFNSPAFKCVGKFNKSEVIKLIVVSGDGKEPIVFAVGVANMSSDNVGKGE
jgi:hypothetical protein